MKPIVVIEGPDDRDRKLVTPKSRQELNELLHSGKVFTLKVHRATGRDYCLIHEDKDSAFRGFCDCCRVVSDVCHPSSLTAVLRPHRIKSSSEPLRARFPRPHVAQPLLGQFDRKKLAAALREISPDELRELDEFVFNNFIPFVPPDPEDRQHMYLAQDVSRADRQEHIDALERKAVQYQEGLDQYLAKRFAALPWSRLPGPAWDWIEQTYHMLIDAVLLHARGIVKNGKDKFELKPGDPGFVKFMKTTPANAAEILSRFLANKRGTPGATPLSQSDCDFLHAMGFVDASSVRPKRTRYV